MTIGPPVHFGRSAIFSAVINEVKWPLRPIVDALGEDAHTSIKVHP